MKLNEAFRKRFEQYLVERGQTLNAFAVQNGIPRSTLRNLLDGNTKGPTLATVYHVSEALDVSIIEFLECDLFLKDVQVD